MERVLVVGGSGQLGRAVVRELKGRGRWVRGASRHPERVPPEADEAVRADALDLDTLAIACAGVDAVVMAAGAPLDLRVRPDRQGFRGVDALGTRHVAVAAKAAGVQKLVYVSVHTPPELDGLAYVAAHREAAEAVRVSGLPFSVVRPTGFFSAFEAYLPLARLGVVPVIGDGSARTNPIHPTDLAAVVADALDGGEEEVPVGGPEVLTRKEAAALAFEAVGKPPRFVRAPDVLLRANAAAVGVVDRRLAELMRFLHAVSHVDVVAPSHGTRRLGPYLVAAASA